MTQKSSQGTYDSIFAGWARWLLARGVRPNHFTFAQLPIFALEIWAAQMGWRWTFISLIAFVIILDGGDGILARVGGLQSRRGAVLDSTFDTLGIAIVLWGASLFYPEARTVLMFLFLGNVLVYLQNALLGEKMVTYLRGPVLTAVAWPETLWVALAIDAFIVIWILTARAPASAKALATA